MACSESSILGDEFIGDDSFDLSYIDTVSLELSTLRYDSVITSTSDRLLLAYQSDSVFTGMNTEGYFLLAPASNSRSIIAFACLSIWLCLICSDA